MANIKMNFLSKTLGRQVSVQMIIPSMSFADCMNRDAKVNYYRKGMKFQTLWLLHGFSGDEEDYVKFSNITRFADDHKIAVVMPAGFNSGYTDKEFGEKYMSFITEELPEICQAFYPLSDKREDNFIGGLSMGGNGTMKIALAYPEKYAAALCMSGACSPLTPDTVAKAPAWFGGGNVYNGIIGGRSASDINTINDGYYMAKKNVEDKKELPAFFISCGTKDFALQNCQNAADYLQSLNYDVTTEWVDGYAHEWDFWDLTLRKAFEKWLPIIHKPIYPED